MRHVQGDEEYDITFVTSDVRGNGHDGSVSFLLEGQQVRTLLLMTLVLGLRRWPCINVGSMSHVAAGECGMCC